VLGLTVGAVLAASSQAAGPAEATPAFILIFKTEADAATPLADACFRVLDSAEASLFETCDNDFQGAPQANAACSIDGVCNDESVNDGEILLPVSPAFYYVEESQPPPGYVLDPNQEPCPMTCKLLFVGEPAGGVGGLAGRPEVGPAGPAAVSASTSASSPVLPLAVASVTVGAAICSGLWLLRRLQRRSAQA
jgi:hypothetical protein